MQAISYKVNDQFVGLLVDSSKAPFVSTEYCKKLIPYIIEEYGKEFNYEVDSGIIKLDLTTDDILDLCYNCMKNISEKIIVEQVFDGNLPNIRHRPLYFGITNDKKGIEIRYEELGEFNSIEKAIQCLA